MSPVDHADPSLLHPSLVLVIALAAGVIGQAVARHLRLPGIVVLLAAGVGLGADGLGWVRPEALGEGLFSIVHLAVAVILFEGGLNLEMSRLRRSQSAIRRLITLGALITLVLGALTAWALLGWEPRRALLFGSLVVVTGPTVIGPLVRELRLRPKVATVLEAEGVLIDPIGALLAVVALEVALAPGAGALAQTGVGLLGRIGFGAAAGAAGGALLALLLRLTRWIPEGFGNITALALVLLLFELSEHVVEHSGILAVTVAGVVVGNIRSRVDRDLREFKDQISILLIGLLFVLLAAGVRFADLRALGWSGLLVVVVLIVVVRPFSVLLCTAGSTLSVRERMLVGWIAPRGIVAAAIASIIAVALEASGRPGGNELRALVFLTIIGTVVVAGATAPLVARLLGLRLPGRDAVAILGAEGLSLALAAQLRERGLSVVLLDANPQHCRRAEEEGFDVVFGNALEERVMQRARFESVGSAVGLTANETLNTLFIGRARELFSVPRGYVAVGGASTGISHEILKGDETQLLFDGTHDVERWNVRERHGEMDVVRLRWSAPPEPEGDDAEEVADEAPLPAERFLMLTLTRGKRTQPMHASFAPQEGDEVAMALYGPDREATLAWLGARGWTPVEEPEDEAEATDS